MYEYFYCIKIVLCLEITSVTNTHNLLVSFQLEQQYLGASPNLRLETMQTFYLRLSTLYACVVYRVTKPVVRTDLVFSEFYCFTTHFGSPLYQEHFLCFPIFLLLLISSLLHTLIGGKCLR